MNAAIPRSLIDGGPSYDHWHPVDRIPTHDTLQQLRQLDNKITIGTDPYVVRAQDDILLAASGETITFPVSKNNGREIEVVMSGVLPVTVNMGGSDTVCGEASVLIEEQWTALRFKSVSGGWILI